MGGSALNRIEMNHPGKKRSDLALNVDSAGDATFFAQRATQVKRGVVLISGCHMILRRSADKTVNQSGVGARRLQGLLIHWTSCRSSN